MIHEIETGDIVSFLGSNQNRIVIHCERGGMATVLTIDKTINNKIECFVRESHFYHKIMLDLL